MAAEAWWFAVALMALAGLALLAYTVRALDLAGSVASFLLGLLVALVGGLGWMLLMVLFSGLGFLATLAGHGRKRRRRVAEPREGERGVANVLGNGAAAGVVVLALFMPGVPREAAALAFAAAIAAVTADTLASEMGVLARSTRSIAPPFGQVAAGANGGVSWRGQAAALVGAALIALAAVPLVGVPLPLAWVPALAGFLGCQVDSLLGAWWEGDAARPGPLGKQQVNFLASLLPALAVLALATLGHG